ncbi:MAG: hypothetical protein HYY01_01245 [Chloroflexi bacterium]|nr:hypothetical protein [Chloroflexota bacterium]
MRQQLPANELYHLRRAVLEAEGKDLAAQMARLAVRQLLPEIEHKHPELSGLGIPARLDIQTGIIETETEDTHGSDSNAGTPPARPA